VVAASAVVTSLQTICSRNVGALESVVVSVTQVHGGTTYNIIPAQVELGGTVRTLSPEIRDLAQNRLAEVAEAVAAAHGCRAEVGYRRGYPVTVNDAGAVALFNDVAVAALGDDRVVEMPEPVMGGEDCAFYGQVVPACFFVLGLIPQGGSIADLHQPTFDFNDDAIATGVELFCRLALRE
jgi:hippurate hydrolase